MRSTLLRCIECSYVAAEVLAVRTRIFITAVDNSIAGIKHAIDRRRVKVIRRVNRGPRGRNQVLLKHGTRRVRGQRRITFADAVAENTVTRWITIRQIVSVDETGRGLAVNRHDIAALEMRVVRDGHIVVTGHRQPAIRDPDEQIVCD